MTAVIAPRITRPILVHALVAADQRRDRAMAMYRDCECVDVDCSHGANLVRCERALIDLSEWAEEWEASS